MNNSVLHSSLKKFPKSDSFHFKLIILCGIFLCQGWKVPCQAQCDGFGASTIFPGLVSTWLSPVSTIKVFWKDNDLQALREVAAEVMRNHTQQALASTGWLIDSLGPSRKQAWVNRFLSGQSRIHFLCAPELVWMIWRTVLFKLFVKSSFHLLNVWMYTFFCFFVVLYSGLAIPYARNPTSCLVD
jgi:hypothetical protein